MSDPHNHNALWTAINEIKEETHKTAEGVARIEGYMQGKKDLQEHRFNWKGALTNAASVGVAAIALIISVFYGIRS